MGGGGGGGEGKGKREGGFFLSPLTGESFRMLGEWQRRAGGGRGQGVHSTW